MNGGKNQRTLLMEILVAVLFFALCSTVLLQTFMAARENSRRAGVQSDALTRLQVLCEQLYAADSAEALLQSEGFLPENGAWKLDAGDYQVFAAVSEEDTGAGVLRSVMLRAADGEEEFAGLPCVRYVPGEAME